VDESLPICDIEVEDLHSYLANGRLNHNTTSGGKALAFHASVRLRLKSMGQLKVGDRIVGIKVRAQVVKNRLGPPLRHADFNILFDRGIDNYGSWLGTMKDNKLVKQAGAWYEYTDTTSGEVIKFQAKDFADILNDEELKDQIYRKICEVSILQYKTNSATEEVDETTDVANESD
jgi:recombination protein RecA